MPNKHARHYNCEAVPADPSRRLGADANILQASRQTSRNSDPSISQMRKRSELPRENAAKVQTVALENHLSEGNGLYLTSFPALMSDLNLYNTFIIYNVNDSSRITTKNEQSNWQQDGVGEEMEG